MKKRKFLFFITLLTLVLLILPSCKDTRSAEDILFGITKDISTLPHGNVYLKSAEEGGAAYLSPAMISALYGEGAALYEFTFVEDFAVYVSSFARPCEVAVYKCYSASDTDLIASMCLSRIDNLKVVLSGTSFSDIVSSATVRISGKFVIVTMVS